MSSLGNYSSLLSLAPPPAAGEGERRSLEAPQASLPRTPAKGPCRPLGTPCCIVTSHAYQKDSHSLHRTSHGAARHLERRVPVSGPSLRSGNSSLQMSGGTMRSEEHTSELQSLAYLVCRLLLEKKKRLEAFYAHPTALRDY